jgi:hypothetical protein
MRGFLLAVSLRIGYRVRKDEMSPYLHAVTFPKENTLVKSTTNTPLVIALYMFFGGGAMTGGMMNGGMVIKDSMMKHDGMKKE